jgi:DNA segregation ATPase FtsK/SpoIIIE, S-DNA-T family
VPRAKTNAINESTPPSRSVEICGLGLLLFGLVLLLALVSFDAGDLESRAIPVNDPPHNWLGRLGARLAGEVLLYFGASAFLLPVLAWGYGASVFLEAFSYLRRNWKAPVAALGLLLAAMGTLDLLSHDLPSLFTRGNTTGAGGVVGEQLNRKIVVFFLNRFGAGLLYFATYGASLVVLTNFELLGWIRSLFVHVPQNEEERLEAEQRALEKKARELAKKTRKLEAESSVSRPVDAPSKRAKGPDDISAAKSDDGGFGIGADLKPIPEPRFQDNSIPRSRSEVPPENVLTIPAGEIQALGSASSDSSRKKSAAEAGVKEDWRPGEPASPVETGTALDSSEDQEIAPRTDLDAGAAPSGTPAGMSPNRGRMQVRRTRPISVASTPLIGNYQLPPLSLLSQPDLTVKATETKEELMANSRLMVQTLAQFGIEVLPGDITRGPTITRYELHPAPGVKLEKIAALTNNITAALKAERINVLAPIPGKSSVGVEVPNAVKTKVIMRDLLESPEWGASKMRVPLALGKDVYGHPIIADLADMPHLLIAGSTGSGKSVCINTIIASLLFRFSPDQLRFVMIDPKVVELQQYNALPHLVVPVVTDPKKVVLALRWVVNEMEKRYQIFAKVGVRNVKSFNERPKDKFLPAKEPELPLMSRKEKVEPGADGFAVEVDEQIVVPRDDDIVIPEKLSYIVVIIDELADLMLVAPADVEMAIARITQMARAAGIHCIVATQRPSVDVITGVIKANIPARIAFQVASKVDSRTILDQMGADKLLGKGDMLYLPPGSAKLTRAQGALITDQEIESIVEFIAKQGKPSYEAEIHQALQKAPSSVGQMSFDGESSEDDEEEDTVQKCIAVIRSEKKASVSLLQRRLKLGYGRASRMMDVLEERGVVGPSKGAEPRDILLDLDGEGYDGGGQTMV